MKVTQTIANKFWIDGQGLVQPRNEGETVDDKVYRMDDEEREERDMAARRRIATQYMIAPDGSVITADRVDEDWSGYHDK